MERMEDGEAYGNVKDGGGQTVYNIRHRAYYFGKEVLDFVDNEHFKPVFLPVYQQLVRCGTSVGANLAEGNSGVSVKDFLNFLRVSLKSANESKFWLCQLRDTVGNDKVRIKKILAEADELSKIIAKIILNTQGKQSSN